MSHVLIAGCGYVGTVLGEALVGDGHTVWGLRRRPERLPAGIEPLAADLTDPAALALPREPPEVVVYAAAPGGPNRDERAYRAIYVEGLRNLLAALDRLAPPAPRILFVSSTAVYGQCQGEWVDETSSTEPTGFAGRCLLEAEALLEGRADATVVRFGGIYGPGRTRLIDGVRGGTATLSAGPSYTNRIHRDDCAGVLRHLMALARPDALYLGVDCEPAARNDVLTWLARQLHVQPPALDPTAPDSPNKRCRNAKLQASGYRFRFPSYREGYAQLLRTHGLAR